MTPTRAIKVSSFFAFIMSGSDIAISDSGSGYDPLIGHEFQRTRRADGGTYHLTANALRDLAEFADCHESAEAQGGGMNGDGNPSGARACRTLATKCRQLAKELES